MPESIELLTEELNHKIRTLEDMKDRVKQEGDRNFTPDEKAEFARIEQEIDELEAKLAEREESDKLHEKIEARVASLSKPRKSMIPKMQPADQSATHPDYPRYFKRDRKLRGFANTREGEEAAYRFGRWLSACVIGDKRSRSWCERNDIETFAMSEGVASAGGVLVPDEVSQRIIDLREQYGKFRQYAYVEPMGTDLKRIARQTGGLTPYFVGEGATITESDATYDQVELIAKKLAVRTRLSAELEEDSMVSIADRFVVDAARALAQKEDQCGFSGDGTSTYGGITGVRTKLLDFDGQGTDSVGAVDATSGDDQFEELIISDFHKLLGLTPAYVFDGDPAWYISQTGWALAMQRLAAALGGVTMAEIAAGMEKRFLGYPVRICQAMPTTTAAQNNEIMLLFGDLSQAATLGNRRDIRLTVDRSVHVATDQIALFAIERFALVVHDVGNATTAGPILGIQGTT